jgi:hypothetical protein
MLPITRAMLVRRNWYPILRTMILSTQWTHNFHFNDSLSLVTVKGAMVTIPRFAED